MDILFLAPHPFYQERGSPIAARLLLQALSERGVRVDALVYHEGQDIQFPNVTLHRIPNVPFVRGILPGFSWKKVVCDLFMFFSALRLIRKKRYQLIHAAEESVFLALFIRWTLKIPYVYDMDSRLSEQISESHRWPATVIRSLKYLETVAIRNSLAIAAMSPMLLTEREQQLARKVMLLRDVSLLEVQQKMHLEDRKNDTRLSLLEITGRSSAQILLYVGNLQPYQGIDLLLESFSLTAKSRSDVHLVVVGGATSQIEKYKEIADRLAVKDRVHFVGPKPVSELASILSQADILISPRIEGSNTPMKLYSYLHSGTVALVTDLETHRQVATDQVALLAKPTPEAISEGTLRLLDDDALRNRLGRAAQKLIEREHSYDAFRDSVNQLYIWLESELDRTV
jgi:glycosyltransferase involved in cell wall biosynthesis